MRESQIVNLLQRGQTNKEIGQGLGISPYTVRDNISTMLLRYGLTTRVALAALAERKAVGQRRATPAGTQTRALGDRRRASAVLDAAHK